MKLKKQFITYDKGDEHIIVSTGGSGFNGMIRGNKTAGTIIEMLKKETTRDEIVDAMFEQFDAPKEVIAADVDKIIEKLRGINALEE